MDQGNLQAISDAIKDIVNTNFTFDTSCINVPHYNDSGFTFESGQVKKGKVINTCVLFVDIRNSVALTKQYSREDMGKLYTSFVKSVLLCADYHHGEVRNIIGDRVMIVFPPKDCYTNAVRCAISINTISSKIIHHYCDMFKCGIGIDYGEMFVHKTGTIKQGSDADSYKSLIWIGRPANIASRLTDVANKDLTKTIFRVTRHPINPNYSLISPMLPPALGMYPQMSPQSYYSSSQETIDMTLEEFTNSISKYSNGNIQASGGEILNFEKIETEITNLPILMTRSVYSGFTKNNPNSDITKYIKDKDITVRDYSGTIYGGDIHWSTIDQINI